MIHASDKWLEEFGTPLLRAKCVGPHMPFVPLVFPNKDRIRRIIIEQQLKALEVCHGQSAQSKPGKRRRLRPSTQKLERGCMGGT